MYQIEYKQEEFGTYDPNLTVYINHIQTFNIEDTSEFYIQLYLNKTNSTIMIALGSPPYNMYKGIIRLYKYVLLNPKIEIIYEYTSENQNYIGRLFYFIGTKDNYILYYNLDDKSIIYKTHNTSNYVHTHVQYVVEV